MATTIRTCTEVDLDAVVRLQRAWAEEEITYGYAPATREALLPLLGPYFLVAEDETIVVGFACGIVVTGDHHDVSAVIPAGQPYLNVDEIYVARGHRDRGIGGRLLDRLTATARANAVMRFLVYSSSKDLDGILRFYRAHGFQSWAVQLFQAD